MNRTGRRRAADRASPSLTDHARRTARLIPLILSGAAACVGAGFVAARGTDTFASILFASSLVGLTLAVGAFRYRTSGRDLLDPLVIISGAICWYFGIHTFWLLDGHIATRDYAYPFLSAMPEALAWVCAGYLCLVFGFFLPAPATVRGSRPIRMYSPAVLALVFAVGTTANVVAAAAGAYSKDRLTQGPSTANLLIYGTIGFTSVIAFAICCCQYYITVDGSHRRTYHRLMWAMLAVLLAFALGVAKKSVAAEAIFAWIAARQYTRSHIRVRQTVVATLVALFVITPIIQSSRTPHEAQKVGTQSTLSSVVHTAESAPGRIWSYVMGLPGTAVSGFDSVNGRTDGTESLALSYRYTPSRRPYQLGATWPEIFTTLIPHYIWPNKPVNHETEQFSVVYAGQSVYEGSSLTVAPTYSGNLYTNFGWPGILVGMCLLGVMLKLVANYRATRAVTIGVPVYVAVMTAAVILEHDVVTLGANLLVQLLACRLTIGGLDLFGARHVVSRQPDVAAVGHQGVSRPSPVGG